MSKIQRKTVIVLFAMLLAAPLLAACGSPIDYADRPMQDRICVGPYPTTC